MIGRVEKLFDETIFKNAVTAMLLGVTLTVLVQSSSITTSLIVPLAGAGFLSLAQVFPYVLGANVGTTVTAILAALVTGEEVAVTVAFAHLLFNITGMAPISPLLSNLYIGRFLLGWNTKLQRLSVRTRDFPWAKA